MKKLSIYREYSPVFQGEVYRVYDDGSYIKTFENLQDAIDWAQFYRDLPAPVIAHKDGDYLIKHEYSNNFEEMRYVMYHKGGYHSSFKTIEEAIDKIQWAKQLSTIGEVLVWQS